MTHETFAPDPEYFIDSIHQTVTEETITNWMLAPLKTTFTGKVQINITVKGSSSVDVAKLTDKIKTKITDLT